jgi:hypothetical protein
MGPSKGLFQELDRRRVFRVMAVYGVVGFVVLQVIDLGTTVWGIPPVALTWAIWIVVVGAPLAGWLTWLFDITPWGILKTPPTGALPRQPTGLIDRRIEFVIIGLLMIALGFGIRGMIADLEARQSSDASAGAVGQAVAPGRGRLIFVTGG